MSEITEYGIRHAGDMMLVRPQGADIDRIYPVDQWVRDQQADGMRVMRRQVIVIEDWAEVPGAGGSGD